MTIFLMVPSSDPGPIEKALEDHKAQQHLDFTNLPKNGYFVSYSGTSQELSNLLGISDGSSGNAVIVAVSSYYGRAPTSLWEWVKSRWEA